MSQDLKIPTIKQPLPSSFLSKSRKTSSEKLTTKKSSTSTGTTNTKEPPEHQSFVYYEEIHFQGIVIFLF